MTARAKVVVVGGGFGGLETVRRLRKTAVDITIIDRKNHHCFQPLLYQVATAALSPADVAWPIRSILSQQANARTVMAEVTAVDTEQRRVIAGGIAYPYDYLVLATGATHSYFNHPEWADVAPGLKTVEDATAIRSNVLRNFETAEVLPPGPEREAVLTFVIIGGGPTGVEMAGAIAEISRTILSDDFRTIDPRAAKVYLIEAGPRLLPSFAPELSAYAAASLSRMGVHIRVGDAVTVCSRSAVETATGFKIASHCILWAAGVRASAAAQWLNVKGDRAGRVPVDAHLKVAGHDRIFVIGDTAAVQSERPIPGVAPAAKQMGRYAAEAIRRDLAGKTPKPFIYKHQGDLATIGRRSAVVSIGRVKLRGFPAWIVWGVAHILFLVTARSRIIVALNWLWEYVTLQRGARLINRPS